ncbi:hypothetical protein KR038_007451 [Drosophila bunnanda]|nr:hypothetical protein KR038_007451 [Drosophila bunnanda]
MAQQGQTSIHKFTCILLGDTNKTKDVFETQLIDGGFMKQELNAQGLKVRPLVFYTTRGALHFNLLDVTSEKVEKPCQDDGYDQAECVIVMFDGAESDHTTLLKKYKDIPTILCGAKGQIKDITKKTKLQYFYNINSSNQKNYEYLFLWLGGQLLGDMTLELLSMIADARPPMEGDFKQV